MKISGADKLFEFGTHEHSIVGNIKNIFTAFCVVLIWTVFVSLFLKIVVGVGINEIRTILTAKMAIYSMLIPVGASKIIFVLFFFSCIFAPLWEELAYRYAPLELARGMEIMLVKTFPHKIRRERGVEYDNERDCLYGNLRGTGFILPVILLSSVVFGQAHGNTINIMVQGVGGVVFSWLMLKCGYWPAVIAHSMWNFMLMFGMPMLLS